MLGSRNGNLEMPNGNPILGSVSQWRIYALIFRGRRMALSATSPTAFQSADAQFGRLIPRIFTRFNGYNASLDFRRWRTAGSRETSHFSKSHRNSPFKIQNGFLREPPRASAPENYAGVPGSTDLRARPREFFPSVIRNGLKISCRWDENI